jgi:UDP-glucose 4-epimerase
MKKIKTAILTGATGYIGKNVTKHLLLDGWRVIHLLRKRKDKKIWNDKVKCYNIENTFTNSRILKKLNKKNTIFIHLASHSSIKDEVKNCQNYINSNISLGAKLLSFMQKNSFNKLITSLRIFSIVY